MRFAHVARVTAAVLALGTLGALSFTLGSEPASAVSQASGQGRASAGSIRPFADDPVT